jgi:histidinol dehydrogenase
VLAAAALAGVDRVFAIGGAGAVAAMAFGTETVPRVDRVVGPGNAYVTEAKLQVCGTVGIDAPAGPSELLIIAGTDAPVDIIAREAIAQAEHDPRASVVIVALGAAGAEQIGCALETLLPDTPRFGTVRESLASRGALLWCDGVGEALAFAARYAPEHLLLVGAECERSVPNVRHAGTVFVGASSSVAFGDYLTGANHVLPTGGAARAYSGLSTLDFLRWTTYQRITPAAAAGLATDVERFACAEGLPAHAAAAAAWRERRDTP